MKSIRTEIIINASKEKVWSILVDFASYAEWNPFIHIQGEAIEGQTLNNKIFLPDQSPQHFRPKVTKVVKGQYFSWLGHLWLPGLFDGAHYFELEALAANQVRLIHGEHFKGILSGLILKMIKKSTLAGFKSMNEAVKARAEYHIVPPLSTST